MKTVLFLVENFRFEKMAEQLARLVNQLEDVSITVQVLYDGEKYRDLFKKHICYKAEGYKYHGTRFLWIKYLYKIIVKERYDIAVAWTEGMCVRILSGCPFDGTKLYCMIHSDLSENGKFTAGFRSWCDAKQSYQQFHGYFVSDRSLIKPFCSVSSVDESVIKVITPIRELQIYKNRRSWGKYGMPETLQVCSIGENITAKEIRYLYKIHTQLLSEGYWHRMIVIAGRKRMKFKRDTFLQTPYNKQISKLAVGCDIFLCINSEDGMLDAMADSIRMGIPAVAVRGVLASSILDQGKRGVLTGNTIGGIKKGLQSMMTRRELRYRCARNARMWDCDRDTAESIRLIEETFRQCDTQLENVFMNSNKYIEKGNIMCYNSFNEPNIVIP